LDKPDLFALALFGLLTPENILESGSLAKVIARIDSTP